MLRSGDRIGGRFRVERVIGEGGMGTVYAVTDERGYAYALKVLLETADEVLIKRFEREAHTIASLSSRHVPRIYGTGVLADGSPYILMELLRGEDLAEKLRRRGTLSAHEVVYYIAEACDGLAEAHRMGMVHRDVKPANLFVATLVDGTRCVKLLDFGISKPTLNPVAPLLTQLTQAGTFVGSPNYMAPEHFLSANKVDGRADIWSLGVAMQELLTGARPFEEDTIPELVSAIMRDPPRSHPEHRHDLPDALVAIVHRCLEKDPSKRYASAEALRADLRTIVPMVTVPPPASSWTGT